MPGVVCRNSDEIRQAILAGMELRQTGISGVHDESSRSHAIIEFEIVTERILYIRERIATYDSYLTYLGNININGKPIPKCFNVKSMRKLESLYATARKAERKEVKRLKETVAPFAAGKMLLCDLAGAEVGSDIV